MLDNLFQSLNLLESRWEHVEANWARSAGWIAISTTRSRPTTFLLLASGRHLIDTKSEASAQPLPMHPALKDGLLEWRTQSLYNQPGDYVFTSERLKGRKRLDLASVLKKKIQPAFRRIGINGVGWHTFRHTVGTMLAEMGQHQLTIRDYSRHSNLHVTNKYLQATSKAKRLAQDKLVDAILPTGLLPAPKLIQCKVCREQIRG